MGVGEALNEEGVEGTIEVRLVRVWGKGGVGLQVGVGYGREEQARGREKWIRWRVREVNV